MNRNEPDLPFQIQLLIGVLLILTLALGVWVIKGWGGGIPRIDTGRFQYEPRHGDKNPTCTVDGESFDCCTAAVALADEAQDKADALEERFLQRVPEDDNSSYIDMTKRMMEELEEAYGYQEIYSALCFGRKPKDSRIPEKWREGLKGKIEI
jgi:hypothetical protein